MSNAIFVDEVVKLTFYCKLDAQVAQFHRYWGHSAKSNPVGNISDVNTLSGFNSLIKPLMLPLLPDVVDYLGCRLDIMRVNSPRPAILRDINPGTVEDDPLPGQVSGLITYYGALKGRHYINRNYIPFPSEDANDTNGKPAGVYQGLLFTLGSSLAATTVLTVGVDTFTFTPWIFPGTDEAGVQLETFRVGTKWATRRSRAERSAAGPSPVDL